MNHSLGWLATAVGVDRGAYEIARYGGPRTPQLRRIGELFTNLDDVARRSLRRLVDEFPHLVEPTLGGALERVDVDAARGAASVALRVDASRGAVWWTTAESVDGAATFAILDVTAPRAGELQRTATSLGPGTHRIRATRAGLASTGVWQRSVVLGTVVVPPAPAPQHHPEAAARPHIEVTHTLDGLEASFVLTGSGFLPNQPDGPGGITIQAVESATLQDWIQLYTGSDASGQVHKSMGPLDVSGLPVNAAGRRQVTFTATDSRKDPTSVPANGPLWSNAVDVTF